LQLKYRGAEVKVETQQVEVGSCNSLPNSPGCITSLDRKAKLGISDPRGGVGVCVMLWGFRDTPIHF